ncbi:DUF6233 domain-containing protein [Streptomyces rishiriensis]|uniref:DUF6233 domain-containing protein n=1 Tax=Streptomyces rishiriensis TaxID=68264 RepID=UPI0037CD1694
MERPAAHEHAYSTRSGSATQVISGPQRRRPVDRDEARRLLADGLRPCTHCRPDTRLTVIDPSDGPTPAPSPTPPEGDHRRTPLPHHRSQSPTRPPSSA